MIITLSGHIPLGKKGILALLEKSPEVRILRVHTTNTHPFYQEEKGYIVVTAKEFSDMQERGRLAWAGIDDDGLNRFGVANSTLEIALQDPKQLWIALLPEKGAIYIQEALEKDAAILDKSEAVPVHSLFFEQPGKDPPPSKNPKAHVIPHTSDLADLVGIVAGAIRQHL